MKAQETLTKIQVCLLRNARTPLIARALPRNVFVRQRHLHWAEPSSPLIIVPICAEVKG